MENTPLSEILTAIGAAAATVGLSMLRTWMKKKGLTSLPPTPPAPPAIEFCKRCAFFQEAKKTIGRPNDSDTQIIRIARDTDEK